MSDRRGPVSVGLVNAKVFDFPFLFVIKLVKEIIKAMTVLALHHFQWLTGYCIQANGHKALAGTNVLLVYQYALYILHLRLRNIIFKHFLINTEYS